VSFRLFRQTRALYWLASVFLFLLLREWLLPLTVLTDTAELQSFYYVIGFVLFVDLLMHSRAVAFVSKLVFSLWLVHSSYFVTPFFDLMWLTEVYSRFITDLPFILQQDWLLMSPITRNLLFYLMLVTMVSLVSYLVLEQKQTLWFVFVTEAFLATLDTFMPYEADGAIIRALVAGFLLLAIVHFAAIEKSVSPYGQNRFLYVKSLVAPLMIICLSVGVAYAAPKNEPAWPDPVAFLTGEGIVGTGSLLKKAGYDNNDEKLGGPFAQDETVIFEAVTNERAYWRGDSKDTYTGMGWAKKKTEPVNITNPGRVWNNLLFENTETKKVGATLTFSGQQFSTIFYPGQLTRMTAAAPHEFAIRYDREHQNLEAYTGTKSNGIPVNMYSYVLTAEVPVASEKKLVQATANYPSHIKQHYLQLPKGLPPRVKELTEQITRNRSTPYEKVKAVEAYLNSSGNFRYETKDVPVPLEGQDFVDQFLFESKRGYCDHFSTSMAVMLRTIGIPTRWVKGFSTGTEVHSDASKGIYTMQVKNKDAHSWVEVYFPGTGWIPFEPTTSFTSPLRVNYDLEKNEQTQPAVPAVNENQNKELPQQEEQEVNDGNTSGQRTFTFSWTWTAALLVLLAVSALIAWRKRERLLAWWFTRKLSVTQKKHFTQKYETLLLLFQRLFMPRGVGETLREYVKKLSVAGDTRQELRYLTELYERICYGNKEIDEKAKEQANQMMERISREMKP